MRITKLELSGFRAFSRPISFNLDARTVIIAGENGQGKTSIFDGIYWAITGRISRLDEDARNVVSMYSETGQARVVLELSDAAGRKLVLNRFTDGEGQSLSVTEGETQHKGAKAEVVLLDTLWPGSSDREDGADLLDIAISRSVYLQQDVLRDFIEADTRAERFHAVSELIGTGRITDLQLQLEASRRAWSEVTNRKHDELGKLRGKIDALKSGLAGLTEGGPSDLAELEKFWNSWWEEAARLEVDIERAPSLSSPEASSAIDTAIRKTDTIRRSSERRADNLETIFSEMERRDVVDESKISELEEEYSNLANTIQKLETELSGRQNDLAEERLRLREQRDSREELKTLAQIALRHLDDRCPVCTQEFDDEITREHLNTLIEQRELDSEPGELAKSVRDLQAELDELRSKQKQLNEQIRSAEVERLKWLERQESLHKQLDEFGIDLRGDEAEIAEYVRNFIAHAREVPAKLLALRNSGEELAAGLASVAEASQKAELRKELMKLQGEEVILDDEVTNREETGGLTGRIIDGLRDASSQIVGAELEEINPLLQRLYSRLDPHPTLRVVKLLSTFHYGRGRLMAEIDDPRESVSTRSPEAVLSSSQLNAMAVSIFLAFNLGLPRIPLKTALLDDPFQALDEVNLLGLVDLLRRFVAERQLIISTHDSRFSALLQRKLRPSMKDGGTKVIQLTGWGRAGPSVRHFEIPLDEVPIRIAA